MGNNSSVSIANITAAIELQNIWKPEMVFRKRFIDDIFIITDITEIDDVDAWLQSNIKHDFLKFTIEISLESVNFLDLTVSIDIGNIINTTIFYKPISKHEYLHFHSKHPMHMKKSLPYSCGLRVIKACSEETDRNRQLSTMFEKFRRRGYPKFLLDFTKEKLETVNRQEIIIPKTSFHLNHLHLHNPEISLCSNIRLQDNSANQNSVFFILPYYEIKNMKNIVNMTVTENLSKCPSSKLKKLAAIVNLQVAFTIPSQLQQINSGIEREKRLKDQNQ